MNRATAEFHPEAVLEGAAAHAWYAGRSTGAGAAFAAEIDRAVEAICEQPARWPKYMHGTRRYLLKRFPFAIVYRERLESIVVVAIAHCSRRPAYWKDR